MAAISISPKIGIAGLLYALAFGSTQTVTITDAYTQEVRVVDNVPTGVAATGSFLTSIGFNLTELFETSFSTPTMTEQGYGFSLDVLKRVRMNTLTVHHLGAANAAKPGSDFYESWSQYIKTCTLIGMELGFIKRRRAVPHTGFHLGPEVRITQLRRQDSDGSGSRNPGLHAGP